MQKLGMIASVLLLASVIVGPVGSSYAQTVDTNKAAKMSHEEKRAMMDKQREERLEAQKQKAAEIKAKMNAKKEAAAKELEAALAARQTAMKENLPRTEDIIAKLKAAAKEAIDARKASGGPSEVQKALEKERDALKKRIEEYKKMIPKLPQKDIKYVKEDQKGREKKLKGYDAVDQYSKEVELKKEYKKAEEIKKQRQAEMHHKNRQ
ncbi:MAG: hypothetical protein AB1299_06185 [Thermoproteota archaeon]|jgi:hypothetical protein|nr:hypothetical protein [Candidatus Nitrosotenuis sp.]